MRSSIGNVRDGLVYYRALKSERATLDRYVASLNVPAATYAAWTPPRQMAFWLDAYNAFVLETVIDHYPIHGHDRRLSVGQHPPDSGRVRPDEVARRGRRCHARRDREDDPAATFQEPRVYLALGRGAIGSGRLRSEAYTADRLEKQLDDIQRGVRHHSRDAATSIAVAGTITVTPILSWRDQAFIAAYADTAAPAFAARSPIERAVLAFIRPNLLPLEEEFVTQNTFRMTFRDFDWRLNDLTGRS